MTRSSRARRVPGGRACLALLLLVPGLLAGCGEEGPAPAPDAPGATPPGEAGPAPAGPPHEDASLLRTEIRLTFHRGEAPVRVPRVVPIPVTREALEEAPEILLEEAISHLVRGPTPEESEQGVSSFFSEETAEIVRSVEIHEDRAVVDFHDFRPLIPNASSSAGSLAFLTELNGTIFANSRVAEVEYRLRGSCEAFWEFLQRECTVVPRLVEV